MTKVEIKARENGPYVIRRSANYTDTDGNEQTTSGTSIALCRCGQSGNKPFCDGTHREVGFVAEEVILQLNE